MLTFVEIAARLRPRWIVWENVPGCLSSGGGRDFGSLLGSLVDLGYGCAWRVLDAQWFGVPQRRRRVFLVARLIEGCAGDTTAAATVLFERESLCGNPPSRDQARQGVAADAGGSDKGGCWWDGSDCAGTLTKQNANGAQRMPDKNNFGAVMQPQEIAGTLGNRGLRSHTKLDGHGAYIPIHQDVSGTIAARFGHSRNNHEECVLHPVPFRKSKRAQSSTDDETWVQAQQANTLNQFDTGERDTHAVALPMTVRRLTPRECERLQGFPDDWTLIPYRNKAAELCPDGPRYKALGNSMAVPCMRWIGERIAAVESGDDQRAAPGHP